MKDCAPFRQRRRPPALARLRLAAATICLTAAVWSAGCATPRPMVEPVFAARTYTPARIALLPPAVFMVLDQYGDNDARQSWQLGRDVTQQLVPAIADQLKQRGYDVSLQARWDGIFDDNGQLLVPSNELGWLANSIVQFANSEFGGGQGEMKAPAFVTPELARKVGWATQSDALLYVNMKGVSVTKGKRTAQIIGTVFIVVIVAAIIALMIAQSREGRRSEVPGTGGGATRGGQPAAGSAFAGTGAMAAAPVAGARPTTAAVAPPVGRGRYGADRGGGRVYRSGPRVSSGVNVGVGVMVPMGGHEHTHQGRVADQDDMYAGDEVQVSLTLVSAHDGRVLWHIRDSVDIDPAKPPELQGFVQRYVGLLPQSLAPSTPGTVAEPSPPPVAPAPAPPAPAAP